MPELPDVTIYVERLRALTIGRPLANLRIASPFVLRTVTPSPRDVIGARVEGVERIGKRIVLAMEADRFVVIHLMIAGRLRWKPAGSKLPAKVGLVGFDFAHGTLVFTEASPKKRASLHLVAGRAGLAEFDRGGLDVFTASAAEFADRLRGERHTVKRSLTDPTLFDGIGNAYSDEILHAAKLSPFRMTSAISDDEIAVLHRACVATLELWTRRMREEVGDGFPDKVTAFRPEMAVHGKFGQPCPVCATPVQRIVYADNEANYCPTCQTEGRLLADRALSRLLKEDWPRSLEELEERRAQRVDHAGTGRPSTGGSTAGRPSTGGSTAGRLSAGGPTTGEPSAGGRTAGGPSAGSRPTSPARRARAARPARPPGKNPGRG